MTYVDRADLIDLLGSAIDHAAARQTLDEALAAHNWAPGARLDPADALALLAQCANRADGVGIAAGLAHQRLALRVARDRGLAAQTQMAPTATSGDRCDQA